MKIFLRGGLIYLLLVVASGADAIPPMKVSVYQGKSRPVYQGTTNADGTFAAAKLRPGHYVVQFASKSSSLPEDQYLLILLAGRNTLISNAIPGKKFKAAGVAAEMNVGAEEKITGQIASARELEGAKVRMINGKRYHWLASELGSNLGGRWVAEEEVTAQQTATISTKSIREMQDRAGEGSLTNAMHAVDYSGSIGHSR